MQVRRRMSLSKRRFQCFKGFHDQPVFLNLRLLSRIAYSLDLLVTIHWIDNVQRAATVPLHCKLQLPLEQIGVDDRAFTSRWDGVRVISHVHEANAIPYSYARVSWGVLLYHAVIIASLEQQCDHDVPNIFLDSFGSYVPPRRPSSAHE